MSDSRSELLAAATEEFAKHGVRGTRIQAIVKRAGVNERMIYHYFDSKDGLYAAVLNDQQSKLGEAWLPILQDAAELEPYEGMIHALQGFYDVLATLPLLPRLWMHEALNGWQTLPLPRADMLPMGLRRLYERGQREGVFVKDLSFELAYGVAIGALIAQPIFAPRFADVVPNDFETGVPTAARHRIVEQLVNGIVVRSGPGG